jgi:acyl-CoA reductase-like NAD-dependent aldehyde dehydrogenase
MAQFDWDRELTTEERDQMITQVAEAIVKRGMATPAILFLEMNKPLAFLSSQALVVSAGFLAPIVGLANLQKFSKLVQSRGNIERLMRRIEDLSVEPHSGGAETPRS